MAPLGRKSKKDIADSQRLQSAMDDLFPGQDVRNMTGRGYLEALKRLRQKDGPAAKRADRTLDKEVLPRILPRRTLGPIDTSWGLKARLALLPSNPHFAQDVALIRKIFELPEDWLDSSYGNWNQPATIGYRWFQHSRSRNPLDGHGMNSEISFPSCQQCIDDRYTISL